ncbi:hypothetical protein [Bacillus sp. UNC41MFS5]|uniref:hypothetical protein n=1 Tax=Bacillus sp. UNC41MFS5 TaxID=1449046 RepID=UPI00047EC01D|nr:hypothetical protein [Bacillus sp. UNC41MFS5]
MSNLDFLEISRNFKSYYRALRDAHYYLRNDSELSQEELQAVTKVLSKLIYGFIRIKGISFREMDREQFEQEFNLFHQDFLNVIQNSGENNVDFDQFTALMDEIIGIAIMRTIALGKIAKVKQQSLFEDVEVDEVLEDVEVDEVLDDVEVDEVLDDVEVDEVLDDVEVDEVLDDVELELSNEDENNDAVEEMVDDMIEEIEVIDKTQETVAEVKPINNTLRTFSTDFGALNNEVEDETITYAGKTFSTEVEPLNNEVEAILYEIEYVEDELPEQVNEVRVVDVINEVEKVKEVEKAAFTPKKVKNNFIYAAPVVNHYFEPESSDEFRFRPRRRRDR